MVGFICGEPGCEYRIENVEYGLGFYLTMVHQEIDHKVHMTTETPFLRLPEGVLDEREWAAFLRKWTKYKQRALITTDRRARYCLQQCLPPRVSQSLYAKYGDLLVHHSEDLWLSNIEALFVRDRSDLNLSVGEAGAKEKFTEGVDGMSENNEVAEVTGNSSDLGTEDGVLQSEGKDIGLLQGSCQEGETTSPAHGDITQLLPPEILAEVFRALHLRDLKSAVLVSNRWKEVGEIPGLWSWLSVTVTEENRGIAPEMLRCGKFQRMRKLRIEKTVSEEIMQAVTEHPGLREVSLMWLEDDLSSEELGLLGRAVRNLESVNITSTRLDTETFLNCITEDSKMRILTVRAGNMGAVNADILARAVQYLEVVNFRASNLQCVHVDKILSGGRKLRHLDISVNNMSELNPDTLASAVTRLETLLVKATVLSTETMEGMMNSLNEFTKLRNLHISKNDIAAVSPRTLVRAVTYLDSLYCSKNNFTAVQLEAMFDGISEHGKLRYLDISCCNLSAVSPELLGKAVRHLEYLDVRRTSLTTGQVEGILSAVTAHPCRLQTLLLAKDNLSWVSPDLLGRAVRKLKCLKALATRLTAEQVVSILEGIPDQSSLELVIDRVAGVPEKLVQLAQHRCELKYIC